MLSVRGRHERMFVYVCVVVVVYAPLRVSEYTVYAFVHHFVSLWVFSLSVWSVCVHTALLDYVFAHFNHVCVFTILLNVCTCTQIICL